MSTVPVIKNAVRTAMKFNIIAMAISKDELKGIWDSLGIDKSDPQLYAAMLELFSLRIAKLKEAS